MKKSMRCLLFGLMAFSMLSHALFAAEDIGIDSYNQQLAKISIKLDPRLQRVDENLATYTQLINIFSNFKVLDINYGNTLLNKVMRGDPLSGNDVYYLRQTLITYYQINQKVLDFANIYHLDITDMPSDFAGGKEKIQAIKARLIFLTGHVMVLDHLIQMHRVYYETNGIFRRIVKSSLQDKEDSTNEASENLDNLIRMSQYIITAGNSKEFARQIILTRETQNQIRKILATDPQSLALLNILSTNPTAAMIAQGRTNFQISYYWFTDVFTGYFNSLTEWLSHMFNSVAHVITWRSGHLKNDPNAANWLRTHLKPMDVLFDRSPFVITSYVIPGYFDHTAMYLGTEEQLKALDLWNHPKIIPYHNDIHAGKVILEAVRTGVRLNSIEGFMDLDTAMIMRKEDGLADPDILMTQITRGMEQIGKPYDFNFDVETLDKIVCSELIYIIYGNVHWPTEFHLGRTTIIPDNIADIMFQKGTRFKMKTYIESTMDNVFQEFNIDHVADALGYVKRDGYDGYFKTTTKCHTLTTTSKLIDPHKLATPDPEFIDPYGLLKRDCQTAYVQDVYQEIPFL